MTTTGTVDSLNAALAGRYRIERELGAGGMARVYLAEDLKHKRKVAVKILRPDLSAALGSERFLREIETKSAHAACSRTSGFVVAARDACETIFSGRSSPTGPRPSGRWTPDARRKRPMGDSRSGR